MKVLQNGGGMASVRVKSKQRSGRADEAFLSIRSRRLQVLSIAACTIAGVVSKPAMGASGAWTGATDNFWADANWTVTPVPGSGDTATFNGVGNVSNNTINLGTGVTIANILFDTPSAAAYTIGNGSAGSQVLTINDGGTITMNSTVVTNQLFNSALVLGTAGSTPSFAFTNNSTTNLLTFAGGITGATGSGVKALTIAGAGNISISGVIGNGTTGMSLIDNSTGNLTLSGLNTYTGGTTVNSGTLTLANGGGTAAIRGILTINPGARVSLTTTDAFGFNAGASLAMVNINGSTLNDSVTGNESFLTDMYLTGGTLSSTGGGAFNFNTNYGIFSLASSTTSTITGNMVNRGSTLNFTTGAGTTASGIDLSVSGIISTNGGTGINKLGLGTMQLTAANTYTGATVISNGLLLVGNTLTGSVATTSGVTLAGPGTIDFTEVAGSSQALAALTFSAGDGNLESTFVGTSAKVTFSSLATRAVGATGNFIVNGGTNGTTNSIVLTGVAANSFINQGAFFGGSSYAWYDTGGFVRAINYSTDALAETTTTSQAAFTTPTDLYEQISGSGAITAQTTQTITTLNIANSNAFNLASGNTLTVNGIMVSGGNTTSINGDTGIQAASGAEMVVNTVSASDNLTINTPILANGTNAFTKSGLGSVSIAASASYTGATTVNGGSLTFTTGQTLAGTVTVNSGTLNFTSGTITGTSTANPDIFLGGNSQLGTMSIGSAATYNSTGGSDFIRIGAGTSSVGVLNNAGTMSILNFGGDFGFGVSSSGALYNTGTFNQNGNNGLFMGQAAGSYGYIYNTGTLTDQGALDLSQLDTANLSAPSAVVDVAGGTVNITTGTGLKLNTDHAYANQAASQINVTAGGTLLTGSATPGIVAVNTQTNSYASINVTGSGSAFTMAGAGGINLNGASAATDFATLSVANGGTVNTSTITNTGSALSSGVLSFNNGSLIATATGTLIATGVTTLIQSGGVIIDNGGFSTTIAAPLLAPTGSGLTGLTLGGTDTGYIGAPVVVISGGGGRGAAAIATFNPSTGTITGITITSPGTGYSSTPAVTLVGGSGTYGAGSLPGAATATASISGVSSGGVTFNGAGTTILIGSSTYTGATTINSGVTLQLGDGTTGHDGIINATSSISNGGTLVFNRFGAVSSAVSITGNGSVSVMGPGSQTLTGANNYIGATTIGVSGSNGSLIIGAGGSLGNTAITVGTGASFGAQPGTGNITIGSNNASLNLNAGGNFNLSDGSIGKLTLNGASGSPVLTLGGTTGSATSLTFDVGTGGTGTGADELIANNGTLSFAGSVNNILLTAAGTAALSTLTNIPLISVPASGGAMSTSDFALPHPSVTIAGNIYAATLATTAPGDSSNNTLYLNLVLAPNLNYYFTGPQSSWNSGGTNFATDSTGAQHDTAVPSILNNVFLTATNATGFASQTLDASFSINALTFTGTGTKDAAPASVTLAANGGGNTLMLSAANLFKDTSTGITYNAGTGLVVEAGSGANTISASILLGGSQIWEIDNASTNPLTVSGVIADGSTLDSLTKIGTGKLILSASNTYDGGTIVNAGTVALGTGGSLLATGTLTVQGTGTFDLAGNSQTLGTLSDGNVSTGIVTSSSGTPTLTVNNAAPSTFHGTISGSLGLTYSGASTLALSSTNTYSGPTTIINGTLQISAANNIGNAAATNTINISGGTLESTSGTYSLAVNQAVTLNGPGTILVDGAGILTVPGNMTDGPNQGLLSKTGTGTLVLSGANTFSGGMNFSAGVVNAGSAGAIPTNGTLSFLGGTLQYTAASAVIDNSAQFNQGVNQAFNIDTNGNNVSYATGLNPNNVTGVTLTKLGTGILTLNGDSSLGTVVVTAGTLTLASSNNLLTGNVTINGGAALNITGSSITDSANNNPNFFIGNTSTGVATLSIGAAATLFDSPGTNTWIFVGSAPNGIGVINNAGALNMVNNLGGSLSHNTNASGVVYNTGTFDMNVTNGFDLGDGNGGYGYFYNTGTFLTNGAGGVGLGWGNAAANPAGSSVLDVAGGTFTVGTASHAFQANTGGGFSINSNLIASTMATSQVNITAGGILTAGSVTNGTVNVNAAPNAYASINVAGANSLFSIPGNGGINLGAITTSTTNDFATLSLANGGTLSTSFVSNTGSATGASGVLSFNGGTLMATAGGAPLIAAGVTTLVEAGGGTIDNGGGTVTVASGMLAPTLNSLTDITLGGTLTGYVGAPVVVISGGGGVGAAAIATFNPSNGTITGITITSPGSGYTTAPTIALMGGSGTNGIGALAGAATATAAVGSVASGGMIFQGSGTTTLSGSSTYTGATNVSAGTVTVVSPGSLPSGSALQINNSSTVNLTNASQTIASLSGATGTLNLMNNSLTISANPGAPAAAQINILRLSGNTGAWTSKLDLTNNAMVIHNSSLATVTNQVQQGYAGGTWQGSGGITSSAAASDPTHLHAIGVIVNDTGANSGSSTGTPLSLYATTFENAPTVDGDILIKYTYYGDANLDGKVDGSDYSRIDSSFLSEQGGGSAVSGWFNGDFNYDGVVNGSDYTLIDNAFNSQGAQIADLLAGPSAVATDQVAGGSVPEPASLGLLGIGSIGLLGHRRRATRR